MYFDVPVRCKRCGKDLMIGTNMDSFKCPFCGFLVTDVRRAYDLFVYGRRIPRYDEALHYAKTDNEMLIDYTIQQGALTEYNGSAAEIQLPSIVRVISSWVFERKNVTKITVPQSVRIVKSSAFEACHALEEIHFLGETSIIEENAFYSCTKLTKAKLPTSLEEIRTCTFFNCGSLVEIVIPSSVLAIHAAAFSYCNNLANVKIFNPNTLVAKEAFEACPSLSEQSKAHISSFYSLR